MKFHTIHIFKPIFVCTYFDCRTLKLLHFFFTERLFIAVLWLLCLEAGTKALFVVKLDNFC